MTYREYTASRERHIATLHRLGVTTAGSLYRKLDYQPGQRNRYKQQVTSMLDHIEKLRGG